MNPDEQDRYEAEWTAYLNWLGEDDEARTEHPGGPTVDPAWQAHCREVARTEDAAAASQQAWMEANPEG